MSRLHIFQITAFVLLSGALGARAGARWDPPRQLSFSPQPSELEFNWGWAVDVDGAGVVHATWIDRSQPSEPGQVFYARSGNDGQWWTAPVPLSPPDAAPPKIAAAGPHVYVAWHNAQGILLRHSPDHGDHWSDPFFVAPSGALPSVNAWGDSVHVVWSAADAATGAPEVFLRSSPDAGGNWTPVRSVSSPDGVSSWVPSVASWGANVHVVWSDERDNTDDCRFGRVPCREEEYYRRSRDFGSSWDPEVRLTHDDPGDPRPSWAPSIAVWGPNVHVSFFDARSGRFEIFYKRSRYNGEPGSWEPDKRVSLDPGPPAQQIRPVIAAHETNIGIVYFVVAPNVPGVVQFVSSPNAGESFHSPVALAFGLHPSVALSPSGTTQVIWFAPDARGVHQIFHRRAKTR